MQMILPMALRIFDPLLENILRLFNKLPMQINRVGINPSRRVILPEDKLGCLPVVLVHLAPVRFALLAEFLGAGAIARGVCFLGLRVKLLVGCLRRQGHFGGRWMDGW